MHNKSFLVILTANVMVMRQCMLKLKMRARDFKAYGIVICFIIFIKSIFFGGSGGGEVCELGFFLLYLLNLSFWGGVEGKSVSLGLWS